jgi:ATP-dependent DNA helicase RecQ
MLCGSASAKMAKLRLDKLSTFGLLKHLRQTEVALLIDVLIAQRCLEQVEPEPFRPVVQLTELGREVMKGRAAFDGALSMPLDLLRKLEGGGRKGEGGRRKAEEEQYDEPPSSPASESLLAALRSWRAEIAEEAGVPLHYILNDETLAELARQRPRTAEDLLTIKGIGPVKAERFGLTLLEIVAAAKQGDAQEQREETAEGCVEQVLEQESARAGATARRPSSSPGFQPPHYWTWRLLQAGFSLDECAAIRGLSREIVQEHAERAKEEFEGDGA